MTDNIDEPLPIVIDKANSFSFNSYARVYHAYMKIWNPVDGAVLVCTRETDNPHDNYAVSIIRNSYVVDHVPLGLSKTFSNFLSLPVSTMYYHWKKTKSWGRIRTWNTGDVSSERTWKGPSVVRKNYHQNCFTCWWPRQ